MMHRSVRSRESHNIRVSSRYPRAGHQHHHSILWPVAGAMFLSGGQSELEATLNLNAMNQSANPWHVSFSYARALQNSCLKTWQGERCQDCLRLTPAGLPDPMPCASSCSVHLGDTLVHVLRPRNLLTPDAWCNCTPGEEGNVKAAQDALLKRAKANSMAQLGK